MAKCTKCGAKYNMNWTRYPTCQKCRGIEKRKPVGEQFPRSTCTAVALGAATVYAIRAAQVGGTEDTLDEAMRVQGWDVAIERIDLAAAAIDHEVSCYPHPVGFWWEYDWYLTVDKVAAELIARPGAVWDSGRLRACLVPL